MQATLGDLQRARRDLQDNGVCPTGLLDARLAQSWERSLHAGLLPLANHTMPDPVSGAHFDEVLHRNAELLAHAKPVVDFLYGQIRGSHCMVVLADVQCLVLHTQGDRSFLDKAKRVALSPGASWHESNRGTNAVGTAVTDGAPIRIRGGEHFLEQNNFLHCSAAPIFSAQGKVAGAIDITGTAIASHGHTLGLASMAARMIENSWLKASYPDHVYFHLHRHREGLDTPGEGIIVMSEDGFVVGANQEAMRLLGAESGIPDATPLVGYLQERVRDLSNVIRSDVEQLRLPNRQRLYVRTRFNRCESRRQAARTGSGDGRLESTAAAADALAATDTGDRRWQMASQKVRRILDKPIALLIQGESGTGKEVFARAVHDSGSRRGRPFVAINCAAIPETLIEAELFGYAPGAYTGARKDGSLGRLREANGGTLFLDEIGDMPLVLQTRLLRVLQERSVTPLGGRPVDTDFSLISATHQSLDVAMAEGHFRSDLFYRINGFNVRLPALREHHALEDLIFRLLEKFGAPRGVAIEPTLLSAMRKYLWPGNLRQLATTLQTACALLQLGEDEFGWDHLADDMVRNLSEAPSSAYWIESKGSSNHGVGKEANVIAHTFASQGLSHASGDAGRRAGNLRTLSATTVMAAVRACAGNVSEAARQLQVSRETVYRYIRLSRAPGR